MVNNTEGVIIVLQDVDIVALLHLKRDGKIREMRDYLEEKLKQMNRSWKWRKRSSVKIAERTYEKRAQALHC